MINAEIEYRKDGYGISITGHAGFAPKGQDIVCAGVSALTSAFFEALFEISDGALTDRALTDKAAFITSDGCFIATISGIKNEDLKNFIEVLIFMLRSGLKQIENQYPDYIKLSVLTSPHKGFYSDTSEQTMNEKREEVKG